MVYLLHFNQRINPTRPTQHYLGYAKDLDERIREHRLGRGARLCQVAKERGISFRVAEVWIGDRSLERTLKRQKNSRRFCPICEKGVGDRVWGVGNSGLKAGVSSNDAVFL